MARNIYISKDLPYQFYYKPEMKSFVYWQLQYAHQDNNPLEKSLDRICLTGNNEFINVSGEIKNFFNYGSANKGLEIRLFAGLTSISDHVSPGAEYRMNLSGRDGSGDYLFDEVFLG